MKCRKRLTRHAKMRINERIESAHSAQELARIASKNGYSMGEFNGELKDYLYRKSISGARIKIYKDNVYVFGKNSKKLITTYSLPNKFIPIDQYIKPNYDYINYV